MSAVLYAMDGAGDTPSSLYTINTQTGVATLVGATGFSNICALAAHPTTGVLYGVQNGGTPALYTINKLTGAATLVVNITAVQPGQSFFCPDMTFLPDGSLVGWNENGPLTDQIFYLDIVSGLFTNKSAGAFTTPPETGLAYEPVAGVLWVKGANTFDTVNATTGATTFFSILTAPAGTNLCGALEFTQAGLAYSLDRASTGAVATLVTIDPLKTSTCVAQVIGSTGIAGLDSLAFAYPDYVAPTVKSIPPTTTPAPQTPCAPKSELQNGGKGQFGCNNGGVGWTSGYAGPYGTVPQHADPADGETLTGKAHAGIEAWIRLYHRDYPSGVVEMIQRAFIELADPPAYEFGRKAEGLLSIGEIEHAIGNEADGFEATTVDITFTDAIDRQWRVLLDDQELQGDGIMVLMASDAARGAF